ncbi:MAG: ATP-binding protein [Acidobacteriota bacterium]|jgi:nitrogen fixation/metabolism regulation signal transduction histidine kinase
MAEDARPPGRSAIAAARRAARLSSTRRVARLSFERRLLALALGAGVPAAGAAATLLWVHHPGPPALAATVALAAAAIGLPVLLYRRLTYTLNTLSNLLEALREEDFSLRARTAFGGGPMEEVMSEVNAVGAIVREQRLGAMEATVLLRKVIDAIDVAVFAFGEDRRLQLVNRAGSRVLAAGVKDLLGRGADDLGLAEFLRGPRNRLVDRAFPGRVARWDVRRSGFRKDGLPVRLIVLSDLSRPLREEERQAWKRLIRVLGHELNNSLAPIKSTAETLGHLLDREPRPEDWDEDARSALRMISQRSEALSRFLTAYSRLARLPPPTIRETEVAPIVRRAAALESRVPVEVAPGPDLRVPADPDQVEQALINLIQNAAEAALEASAGGAGSVRIGWRAASGGLELWVEDSGPGLSNPENLFVPFYTTKPEGTGIGLVLARQIAEAHGGTVTLEERPGGRGCLARMRLGVWVRPAGS